MYYALNISEIRKRELKREQELSVRGSKYIFFYVIVCVTVTELNRLLVNPFLV